MSDLFSVLPDLPSQPFSNLIPSLEKHHVSTTDLLTLDAADVAKRAQIPLREVRRLTDAVLGALHRQLGVDEVPTDGGNDSLDGSPRATLASSGDGVAAQLQTISTLDGALDAALGGGIPAGYVTEITGESAAGKTQLLLTLLLAVQLPAPSGLSKNAIYISTEGTLQTSRLSQFINGHPRLSTVSDFQPPTLSNILSIKTPDLESQDHILRYQLPTAIRRHNVGLIVLDSVTANFRAELGVPKSASASTSPSAPSSTRAGLSMARRAADLMSLGHQLRHLARHHGVAVVLANQVLDRFHSAAFPTDPLTLAHQQRFFTGWGDVSPAGEADKTPCLGLVWSHQLDCRVALLKRRRAGPGAAGASKWRRHLRVAFSSWAPAPRDEGVEFEIWESGVHSVRKGGDEA